MRTVLRKVTRPFAAFRDRADAGRALSRAIRLLPGADTVVLAVPRGGVAVAAPLAEALGAPLELMFVRKLPMPHSPEAGFGAVALDGQVVLNEPLVRELDLSPERIESIVQEVLAEVRRRAREYTGRDRPPEVRGKQVCLVDDGLATGFTMIAAARMVKACAPSRMTLCVPVSPHDSLRAVEPYFDDLYCLIEQAHPPFAVASFYEDFHDLTDDEVRAILRQPANPA
ncbi:MAG: phosphoribosyltransferase [Candidatus Brocadiia bacterium]